MATPTSRHQRCVDAFSINPTVLRMDESDNLTMPVTPPQEVFALKPGRKTPEAAASIRDLQDEPIFWRGYTSEEELASPVDNDDFSCGSLDSDSESFISIGEGSFHTPTAVQAQQLCSQAQAVQVVSVGKAKVVSMPRLVDVGSLRTPSKTTIPSFRQSNSDLIRMYYERSDSPVADPANTPSPCSSEERWPFSETTFQDAEQHNYVRSVRRKPNLSPLQIVPRSESPYEITSVPRTISPQQMIKTVSFQTSKSQACSRTTTPPITLCTRQVHKLSSKFSLRTLSKGFKRTSTLRAGSRASTVPVTPSPYTISQCASQVQFPSSPPSRPLPKMIPRGANERAPLLVLPPCPYDDDNEEYVPTTSWPLRDEPVGTPSPISFRKSVMGPRARRKSLPAYASSLA